MSGTSTYLTDYPELSHWYSDCDDSQELPILAAICECLRSTPRDRPKLLFRMVGERLVLDEAFRSLWLEAYVNAKEMRVELDEVLLEIATQAILHYPTDQCIRFFSGLANATDLDSHRFLSAWVALNFDKLELALDECERIDEPLAPVLGIQGQVLLELGKPGEAELILSAATKLAPYDPMPRFHLAKAFALQEQFENALTTLLETDRMIPHNPEVALFGAMLSLQFGNTSHANQWLKRLSAILTNYRNNEDISLTGLELAIDTKDKAQFEWFLSGTEWSQMNWTADGYKKVARILKKIQPMDSWQDVQMQFLRVCA